MVLIAHKALAVSYLILSGTTRCVVFDEKAGDADTLHTFELPVLFVYSMDLAIGNEGEDLEALENYLVEGEIHQLSVWVPATLAVDS